MMGETQIGHSKSCNSSRSAALCCQPSIADLSGRVAEAVQQHQRHQPSLQIGRDIGRGISVTRKQALHPARHAAGHEHARTEQVIFAPPRHHVAEIDQPRQTPARIVPAQQEILRNIFAGQDHRWPVQRDQSRGIAQEFIHPIQKFPRQPEPLVPCATSLDLSAHEDVPAAARSARAARSGRAALAQWSRRFRQGRCSLSGSGRDGQASAPSTPDSRVMTRYGHPSRSPSTTISGIGMRSCPRSCASVFVPRLNWPRRNGGKIFRMSFSSRARTRLVPVAKTCGAVHARPWLRAISCAIGSHCAGSARKARNGSSSVNAGSNAIMWRQRCLPSFRYYSANAIGLNARALLK